MAKVVWVAVVLFSAGVAATGLTLLTEQGSRSYKFLEQPKEVKTTTLPAPSELDLSKTTTIPLTDKTTVRTISIPRPQHPQEPPKPPEPAVVLPAPAIPDYYYLPPTTRYITIGHQHHGKGGCPHGGVKVTGGKARGKTWHCEYRH